MSPEQMRQKAIDLFMKRFHCSQVILSVGLENVEDLWADLQGALAAARGMS